MIARPRMAAAGALLLVVGLLCASPVTAQDAGSGDERAVAEWLLGQGAALVVAPASNGGREERVVPGQALPDGPLRVLEVDALGTHIAIEALAFAGRLPHLRALALPPYLFNAGAGDKRDANGALRQLAGLRSLRTLVFGVHFLTELRITDEGLRHLAGLRELRELRLTQAQTDGSGLAGLTGLQRLDLSSARVTDKGLETLATMRDLRHLILRNTAVSDAGAPHLGKLRRLEELDLYGCRLTDAGVAHLGRLRALRRLDLTGSSIGDAGAAELARLPALVELNLYRNPITNAGLQRLAVLRALRFLDVRYTRVTRSGVAALQRANPALRVQHTGEGGDGAGAPLPPPRARTEAAIATWVEQLGGRVERDVAGRVVGVSLRATSVGDAELAHLRGLRALARLDLGHTEVGDDGIRLLPSFAARATLRELVLDDLRVTDRAVRALGGLPGLARLGLRHTPISGAGLGRLRALEVLDAADTAIEPAGWKEVAALPALRELDVSYTELSDATLGVLASGASAGRLERLRLATTRVSPRGAGALAAFVGLRELGLAYVQIGDALAPVLPALARLERLDLTGSLAGDATAAALAGAPALRVLRLDWTKVSDGALGHLARIRTLTELGLDHTRVTDAGARALAQVEELTRPRLSRLDLGHTGVGPEALEGLRRALPGCAIVWDGRSSIMERR